MEHILLVPMEVSSSLTIGSWSSIDSTKNNTVNAFSYYKDNIIVIEYQPDEKKIVFRKKDTEETHTL